MALIGSFTGERTLAVRRARVLCVVSLCMALVCLFFLIYDSAFGEQGVYRYRITTFALFVVFTLIVYLGPRRFGAGATLFLATIYALSIGIALQTGRGIGIHFFLLALGPMMPIFFGTRRPISIAIVTVAGVATFLAIEFIAPTDIVLYQPWLPQLRNPLIESLDLDYGDSIFMLVTIAFQIVLTVGAFAAFRTSENAEAALEREYARSEMLLQSLLPRPIAARLKEHPDDVIADEFDLVSVLFADVVNFTPRASGKRPQDVVRFLDRIFGEFDQLAEKHGLEKIKTIGDAYMVAGGMPVRGGDHTSAMANMALDMIEAASRITHEFGEDVSVRIGLHAGPAVAGVIGRRKPFYDVWGDTINIASRLESSGIPGRIQITPEVKAIIGPQFITEERGVIEIKGKGSMQLFFLNGHR